MWSGPHTDPISGIGRDQWRATLFGVPADNRRARDIDRSLTCTNLDYAYAEGQLDHSEHTARVAKAMAAKTLGELASLTDDLQLQPQPRVDLRKPRPQVAFVDRIRRVDRKSWVIIAAIVAAIVAVIATVLVVQEALDSPDLFTVDGFDTMVSDAREHFGDTRFDSANIFQDYAVLTRSKEGSPDRSVSYTYRHRDFDEWTKGTRETEHTIVDLADVNVAAVLALLDSAPKTLHVDDPTSRSITIGSVFGDYIPMFNQEVSISLSNEFNEHGKLDATLDGKVKKVTPNG